MGYCEIRMTQERWSKLNPQVRRELSEMNREAARQDPTLRGGEVSKAEADMMGTDQRGFNK